MVASDATVEAQPVLEQAQPKTTSGWRFTLLTGSVSVLIVFIINLSITLWALRLPTGNKNEDTITSRRIIFEGSCATSKNLNVLLHLLINIFSCILLAASSYGMQCLSAPTRVDVDRAHARREWMDVGILSIRNLDKISGKRFFLWALLGISSLPLHLLYNSVVFASLSVVDYSVYNIDERIRSNASFSPAKYSNKPQVGELFQIALRDNWDNLTSLECIDAYATGFQTARSDVFLVCDTSPDSSLESIYDRNHVSMDQGELRGSCRPTPFDWMCEDPNCSVCSNLIADVRKQPENWKPFGHRVKYCLSKPVRQVCRVNFSIFIAAVILGANIVKAGILIYVALRPPKQPLLVLGDAIQSFLENPEPSSRNMCLVCITSVKELGVRGCVGPKTPSLERQHWAAAISRRRWATGASLYCLALGITLFFLSYGIRSLVGDRDIKTLWQMGFGTVSETALITGIDFRGMTKDNETLVNIFFANIPQLSFSILYFQYNGLFTCMLSSREWSSFGQKRKAIRVSSHPRGEQRSRYFLQLPYRFGIPLIILSILMHWMLSQSIFIVVVESMTASVSDLEWNFATCGYSPIAIIFVVITSLLMVAWVAVTGSLKLPTAIPVVGSCSLAIAAACHHPNGLPQPDAPLVPIQWGVMRRSEPGDGSGYGHCGLSSEEVGELQDGEEYL